MNCYYPYLFLCYVLRLLKGSRRPTRAITFLTHFASFLSYCLLSLLPVVVTLSVITAATDKRSGLAVLCRGDVRGIKPRQTGRCHPHHSLQFFLWLSLDYEQPVFWLLFLLSRTCSGSCPCVISVCKRAFVN
jgi:hypothetical protein